MKTFNLTISQRLVLLRISLAIVFLAHASVRLFKGTISNFALFFQNKHIPFGLAIVWGITIFEIAGGLLLMFGYFKKWISIGLILMLLIGIILIHAQLGWFVGEHGTGGVEYSFILIIALFVIMDEK